LSELHPDPVLELTAVPIPPNRFRVGRREVYTKGRAESVRGNKEGRESRRKWGTEGSREGWEKRGE